MLIENVTDYLEHYNIEYKQHYGELIITCPVCEKEKHLYIKAEDGCWICHHCGEKGSWSQFTQKIGGENYVPLKSNSPLYLPAPKPQLKLNSSLVSVYHKQIPERIIEYLTGFKRGLTQETIKQFQLGWDGNSITIPILTSKEGSSTSNIVGPRKK
jgi:DNA primase